MIVDEPNRTTKRKKCFIITPIGDEGSDIRRHIDGIIDAVIEPVIKGSFDYDIEVAHRIDEPGNIPKQVIVSIYESDLVIANLTFNNPNVMYELALRHCFGTPVIMIAEKGTKIPADIIGERTIFYTNDAKGVIELKTNLENMVNNITLESSDEESELKGPVYDALRAKLNEEKVIKSIHSDEDVNQFSVILRTLEEIKASIPSKKNSDTNSITSFVIKDMKFKFYISNIEESLQNKIKDKIIDFLTERNLTKYDVDVSERLIRIVLYGSILKFNKIIIPDGISTILKENGIIVKSVEKSPE